MDWNAFFERTRAAAGVDSFAKLAPMIGVTDGAIGHYRQGRRVPQAWVVAACLRVQGHEHPERGAAEILKSAAATSDERRFWKQLGTAALIALCAMPLTGLVVKSEAYASGLPESASYVNQYRMSGARLASESRDPRRASLANWTRSVRFSGIASAVRNLSDRHAMEAIGVRMTTASRLVTIVGGCLRFSHLTVCDFRKHADRPRCAGIEDQACCIDNACANRNGSINFRAFPAPWGHSSAGRAPAWHAGGRRFDPAWLHQVSAPGLRRRQQPVHSVPIV
jgi:hypothetical protein